MSDLPLDEVAKRIVDAILNERFINRETITPIVRASLKIWLKHTDKPDYSNIKSDKATLIRTDRRSKAERDFHKEKLKQLLSEEDLKEHYRLKEQYLIDNGF